MKKIDYIRQIVEIRTKELQKDRATLVNNWEPDFIDGIVYGLELVKNELKTIDGMSESTMEFLIDFRKKMLGKKN